MKKNIFLVIIFFISSFIFSKNIYAQELGVEYFDCSKSGECKNKKSSSTLYADNMIPGYPVQQSWNISNKSNNQCRVYLFFKGYDDETSLSDKIKISALGNGEIIVQDIIFSDLLKKESLHLVEVPSKSDSVVDWNIILDVTVDNNFQGSKKEFKTILYSYCIEEPKGRVAGVSTEKDLSSEEMVYISLATISGVSLIVIKIK